MTLRDLRKSKNLTLDEVAKSVGITYTNLSRIERGAQLPKLMTAQSLAKFYGTSAGKIYDLISVSND